MSRKKLRLSELNTSTIGGRIAYLRIKNELTQDKLAEKLDTSKGNISSWESGEYQPSFEKFVLISELFPGNDEWLLHGKSGFSATEASVMTEKDIDEGTAMQLLLDIFRSKNDAAIKAITSNLEFFSEAVAAVNKSQTDRRKTADPHWPLEKEKRQGGKNSPG